MGSHPARHILRDVELLIFINQARNRHAEAIKSSREIERTFRNSSLVVGFDSVYEVGCDNSYPKTTALPLA